MPQEKILLPSGAPWAASDVFSMLIDVSYFTKLLDRLRRLVIGENMDGSKKTLAFSF